MSNTILLVSFTGIIILLVIGIISLFNILKKQLKQEIILNQEQFLQIAKQQFEIEQGKSITELETRKQAVEDTVSSLKDQLNKYEQLIKDLEKDRAQKYGNLENELKHASQATIKLQDTTNKLNDILGNVKLRGQWGERMAEDIIKNAGLIENINYRKQKKLASSDTKPDYTFLLPDKHVVNMDVKFPLDNYLRMINSQNNNEKQQFEKEFIKNVRDRIKELKNRDYINPEENTLDFVMLFIPNEQVFGFIQDIVPEIFDNSLKQKVVLCSPFTLYAMLSIIRQAYENFRFEKDIKNIITHISLFSKSYDKFKIRFEDIGKYIENLERKYNDVKNIDFNKLNTKIRQIENYKKGNALEIENPSDITNKNVELLNDDIKIQ